MPTAFQALLRDDGSGGVGGLTGEHELCALSYNSSDEPTEVVVLVKNEGGNELSTEQPSGVSKSSDPSLVEDKMPSDGCNNSSATPMMDKSASKKMPENEKALALGGLKDKLLSGNISKGTAKENASPQKGTNDGSFATLGCTNMALFESGGSEDAQVHFGTKSVAVVSAIASVKNDLPAIKRPYSDIINENGPAHTADAIPVTIKRPYSDIINNENVPHTSSVKKNCSWKGAKNGALKCSSEGCTNWAVKEGVCVKHGKDTCCFMSVNFALNIHTSAVLTLMRQTAAKGEKCVPESLLNPVREETLTALRTADFLSALSRTRALIAAENGAIQLYNEEVRKKEAEEEVEQQKTRLEAMPLGGTDNEEVCGRKSVLVYANVNNISPATTKRLRPDNEDESEPVKKRSKKKECSCDDPKENEQISTAIEAVEMNRNKKPAAGKVTLPRGVTVRPSGKWQAQIYYAGKSRYIGVFESREDACYAYEVAGQVLMTCNEQNDDEVESNINLAKRAAFAGVEKRCMGATPLSPASRARALIVAENDATLLYAEEVRKKKEEEEEEGQQQKTLEATLGETEQEGHRGRESAKRLQFDNENESGPFKKRSKKCEFSADGCTNKAVQGGVCKKHGAKVNRYECRSEGCTNKVVQGGVCIRHGAKTKRCSWLGCTKKAIQGGVCRRHGAKVKLCSSEGCTNQVQKGGVCIRHGAKDLMKKA